MNSSTDLSNLKVIVEKPIIRKSIIRHSTTQTVIHRSVNKPIIQNITAKGRYNEVKLKSIEKRSTSATKVELKYRKTVTTKNLLAKQNLPDVSTKPIYSSKTRNVKYIGPIFRPPIIKKIVVNANNNGLLKNSYSSGILRQNFSTGNVGNVNSSFVNLNGNFGNLGVNKVSTSVVPVAPLQ